MKKVLFATVVALLNASKILACDGLAVKLSQPVVQSLTKEEIFNGSVDRIIQILAEENEYYKTTDGAFMGLLLKEKDALLPFLTRSFEEATFSENGAFIATPKEELFYRNMLHFCPKISGIPYRTEYAQFSSMDEVESVKPNFYTRGTLRGTLTERYVKLSASSKTPRFPTCTDHWGYPDIYQIRKALGKFEGESFDASASWTVPEGTSIVLFPNDKDAHSTLVIGVLDQEKKKVLLSLLMNSWENEVYFSYLLERFNMWQDCRKSSIPFFDCSYKLQGEEKDMNCALYAYNTMCAIVQMMESDEMVAKVVSLSKILEGNPQNAEALGHLKKIFQEDLKSYLPAYYDKSKKWRSEEELKAYHLRLRWDLSSEWLAQKLSGQISQQ